MRVLIPWYNYPPSSETSIGGLSVSLASVARSLHREGVNVEVICPPVISQGKENFESPDVIVHRNKIGEKIANNQLLTSQEENELLANYDKIISINNFGAGAISKFKKKDKLVRQIHTVAHDRPLWSYTQIRSGPFEFVKMYVLRGRERRAERALKGIRTLCVSIYNLEKLKQFDLEEDANLFHIPNSIDTTLFRPLKLEKKYDLLFIGRFQRLKGLDILMQALNLSSKRGNILTVGIVGPFTVSQQRYCRALLREEIRDSVAFLGLVAHESIPNILSQGRVLVVPSRYESFSLPVLEGIACGIPVVASEVGGISELMDEETGILVDSIESSELADQLIKTVQSDGLQETALNRGPKKAKNYDQAIIAKKIVANLSQ
jgi:glycosyltransferase involved in cell wall biosynthesis